jgi:hypothetical protein
VEAKNAKTTHRDANDARDSRLDERRLGCSNLVSNFEFGASLLIRKLFNKLYRSPTSCSLQHNVFLLLLF